MNRYPAADWPVLAFTGAPASFPVTSDNAILHKYLNWSDKISEQANDVIDTYLPRPFIGVHLRIGSDWVRRIIAGLLICTRGLPAQCVAMEI